MSGGQLRLKVSIDGQETRRFALQAPITQARLADLIASVLPAEKAKATFVIQYTDDEGELITIGSDADLKEAITLMEEMNLKALKLSVGTTFSGPKVATAAPLKAEAVPVKAEAAPAPAPQVEEEKKEEGAVPQSDQEKFEAALQYLTSQFTRLDAELVTPEILGLVTLVQQLVVNLEAGQKVTWEKVTQDAQHLAPVISSLPCFHEESDKFLNSLEAIAKFFIEHVESGLLYPIPPQFAPLLVCKSESILKKLSTIEGIPLQLSVILEHMASFASKLETVESQGSEAGDSKEEESNVHVGVQCDNCQANPIVGNRYKCTACHNFDLCETCEASGVHPEDHELVKFKVPQKKNRRHGGGRHHHWGGPQAWGPFPGMEFAAAAAAGGHCHGGRRWRNSGSGFAPRRMASPVAPAAPALKDGLSLHFVNDVNMPDKTVLERGSFVVKSWTVKNDGKQDWDNEVKLVYVSGNKEGLLDGIESYDVALLKSGETGDLNVPLVAPAKPGTYRTVFRLAKNGVQFGHHIWVEFLVQ